MMYFLSLVLLLVGIVGERQRRVKQVLRLETSIVLYPNYMIMDLACAPISALLQRWIKLG